MSARDELFKLVGIDVTGLVLNLHRQINAETRVIFVPMQEAHIHHIWSYPLEDGDRAEINWESWQAGQTEHRIFYDAERNILFIAQVQ